VNGGGLRNQNTEAATASNILRKQRRWAEELRSCGWYVAEAEEISGELLLISVQEQEATEDPPRRKPSPRPRTE
jgi:hypothetical protein